ncbi:hypothetical protein LIA77_10990 [Sarocladium implicatum]|nr:hypothetical protein LIA77_10990 [Sarocladium implicatum]
MIFSDIYKGPRSPLAKLRHQSSANTAGADTSAAGSSAPAVTGATVDPAAGPDWVNDEFADLLSKDKHKQKEAVKRYLSAKVKNDWVFAWPPSSLEHTQTATEKTENETNGHTGSNGPNSEDRAPQQPQPAASNDDNLATEKVFVQDEIHDDQGYQVDESDDDEERLSVQPDNDDSISIYSIVSEDPLHYRPRMDWTSDASDSEMTPFGQPFRFHSPNDVGADVQSANEARKAKRRREAREEAKWNDGLACFEARRNAWTGARTVRIKSKPSAATSTSPRSTRRWFSRRSISSSPPTAVNATQAPLTASNPNSGADTPAITSDESSHTAANDSDKLQPQRTKDSTLSGGAGHETSYLVQTLIPLAPPILPPENCLRASISPAVYINLYEKVILSNLQPSCPINLSDMIRSCVVGWQRDGEWPPRSVVLPTTTTHISAQQAPKKTKRMSANVAGGDASGNNVARRMSFGLLGKEREKGADEESAKGGKGFRKSLQKAFGMGEGTIVR